MLRGVVPRDSRMPRIVELCGVHSRGVVLRGCSSGAREAPIGRGLEGPVEGKHSGARRPPGWGWGQA